MDQELAESDGSDRRLTEHWKSYWDRHAAGVGSDDPLRQVLRVVNRRPISDEAFGWVTRRVVELLELEPHHVVLDLCCGNGLLSAAIEPHCARVVAVDFCERLLRDVGTRTTGKTTTMVADARTVEFRPGSFDRVLIAAAIQHFEQGEAIRLIRKVAGILRPGGIMLVTDVPDNARMWHFHDSGEREDAYFENEARDTPILGTWYERSWMEKLGRHAGFRQSSALDQPPESPSAHYRFDLQCRR